MSYSDDEIDRWEANDDAVADAVAKLSNDDSEAAVKKEDEDRRDPWDEALEAEELARAERAEASTVQFVPADVNGFNVYKNPKEYKNDQYKYGSGKQTESDQSHSQVSFKGFSRKWKVNKSRLREMTHAELVLHILRGDAKFSKMGIEVIVATSRALTNITVHNTELRYKHRVLDFAINEIMKELFSEEGNRAQKTRWITHILDSINVSTFMHALDWFSVYDNDWKRVVNGFKDNYVPQPFELEDEQEGSDNDG